MKIECSNQNCKKESIIFHDPISYANHILEKHRDDETAMEWANIILNLAKEEESKNSPAKKTYLGKPLNRIPPKRHKKLPSYLQKQLNEQLERNSW